MNRIDRCDVEHFDPRLKHTAQDGYWNWYAVLSWMNAHKPRKIEPFLPILSPFDDSVRERISYDGSQFFAVNEEDVEAKNLILFLGWNRPEVAKDRSDHVHRIRDLFGLLKNDAEEFKLFLLAHPENCSFCSALTFEFGAVITSVMNARSWC